MISVFGHTFWPTESSLKQMYWGPCRNCTGLLNVAYLPCNDKYNQLEGDVGVECVKKEGKESSSTLVW